MRVSAPLAVPRRHSPDRAARSVTPEVEFNSLGPTLDRAARLDRSDSGGIQIRRVGGRRSVLGSYSSRGAVEEPSSRVLEGLLRGRRVIARGWVAYRLALPGVSPAIRLGSVSLGEGV